MSIERYTVSVMGYSPESTEKLVLEKTQLLSNNGFDDIECSEGAPADDHGLTWSVQVRVKLNGRSVKEVQEVLCTGKDNN